jgi:hypothetical protein
MAWSSGCGQHRERVAYLGGLCRRRQIRRSCGSQQAVKWYQSGDASYTVIMTVAAESGTVGLAAQRDAMNQNANGVKSRLLVELVLVCAAFEVGAGSIRSDPARPPRAGLVGPGDRPRGCSPTRSWGNHHWVRRRSSWDELESDVRYLEKLAAKIKPA